MGDRPLRRPRADVALVVAPAAVAAVVSVAIVALAGFTPDGHLFAAAGRLVVSNDAFAVFEDSEVQVGPLYLALAGVVSRAGRALGMTDAVTAPLVLPALAVAVLAAVPVGARPDRAAGALAVALAGPVSLLAVEAHFEELLVAAVLMGVAWACRSDHVLLAGTLLAVSGGLKLWGLLGVPVLLLLPTWRRAAKAALAAAVVTALIYGPFVLFGDMRTFDHVWPISTESPVSLLVRGESFGWTARAAQTAFVVGVAGLLALRWRQRPDLLWAVPLAVICLRIVTDPIALAYYWAPPVALVLMGVWSTGAPVAARLQATVLMMVLLCVMILTAGPAHLVAMLLAALGATAFAERNRPDRLAIPTVAIDARAPRPR